MTAIISVDSIVPITIGNPVTSESIKTNSWPTADTDMVNVSAGSYMVSYAGYPLIATSVGYNWTSGTVAGSVSGVAQNIGGGVAVLAFSSMSWTADDTVVNMEPATALGAHWLPRSTTTTAGSGTYNSVCGVMFMTFQVDTGNVIIHNGPDITAVYPAAYDCVMPRASITYETA